MYEKAQKSRNQKIRGYEMREIGIVAIIKEEGSYAPGGSSSDS